MNYFPVRCNYILVYLKNLDILLYVYPLRTEVSTWEKSTLFSQWFVSCWSRWLSDVYWRNHIFLSQNSQIILYKLCLNVNERTRKFHVLLEIIITWSLSFLIRPTNLLYWVDSFNNRMVNQLNECHYSVKIFLHTEKCLWNITFFSWFCIGQYKIQ